MKDTLFNLLIIGVAIPQRRSNYYFAQDLQNFVITNGWCSPYHRCPLPLHRGTTLSRRSHADHLLFTKKVNVRDTVLNMNLMNRNYPNEMETWPELMAHCMLQVACHCLMWSSFFSCSKKSAFPVQLILEEILPPRRSFDWSLQCLSHNCQYGWRQAVCGQRNGQNLC